MPRWNKNGESIKVMQSYGKVIWDLMQIEAYKRDTTVQNLVRTIIIPDWLKSNNIELPPPKSEDNDKVKEQPSRTNTGWVKKNGDGSKPSHGI